MKSSSSNSSLKRMVGYEASKLIKDGMLVGIGTGSTVAFFAEALGDMIRQGLSVKGLPTSYQSKLLCIQWGIPLLDPMNVDRLDIVIDGADEMDSALNAIKGGGAAHTQEKVIASMADQFIIIADESKMVENLCAGFPLPVEVIPGALAYAMRKIRELDAAPHIRMAVKKDGPVITENGNFILDLQFAELPRDLHALDARLKAIPGLLETGLFLGLAKKALIGIQGSVKEIYPQKNYTSFQ